MKCTPRIIIVLTIFSCLTLSFGYAAENSSKFVVNVKYPSKVPHISDKAVYPSFVFGMDSAKEWWFGGAGKGHTGGVRVVDSPGRPGEKALEFFFATNRKYPRWLCWQRMLSPQLSAFKARELVFDVYPITELNMDITARFGSQQGQTVIPITWFSIGRHKPGKWHEVRMPVCTQRYIDKFRFDFHNQSEGVPDGKQVRFIIDNIRFEPQPNPIAEAPIGAMETREPLSAAYMELSQGLMLCDKQKFPLSLEIRSAKDLNTKLRVTASRGDKKHVWQKDITLKKPFSVITGEVHDIPSLFGSGPIAIDIEIVNSKGERLAWLARPLDIATFQSADMEKQCRELLVKHKALQTKVDKLISQGVGVEPQVVSLTVAKMFLENYIPHDFKKIKAYKIAMQELVDIRSILDAAELELSMIANLPEKPTPFKDYDPTKPVEIKDGNFVQNGRPIVFIGALTWIDQIDSYELSGKLGFNGAVCDIPFNNWYMGNSKGPQETKKIIEIAQKSGISVSFQLASHNLSKLSPEDAAAKGDGAYGGDAGLPWNVLMPETRKVFARWYDQLCSVFSSYPNVLNLGLANEPVYQVSSSSKSFAKAFRKWAAKEYSTIDLANKHWGTSYKTFESIDLPSFFESRKKNVGADYDWNEFRAKKVAGFFSFLTRIVKARLPHVSTSINLCGEAGYLHLDEQEIFFQNGQTVHGADSGIPMFVDYMKSLDPELPVYNGGWQIIFSEKMGNDPKYLSNKMFHEVAHGISAGYVWQWARFDWHSTIHGAIGSITRYPLGLNAMGRTSLKLRRLMPIIARFGKLDGGKARLLYSKVSHLHQKKDGKSNSYFKDLELQYDLLSANTSGVRYVIPETLKESDLNGISLLAMGSARYIQTKALKAIEDWVKKGGTLWLTSPGLQLDPWGVAHQGISEEFLSKMSAKMGEQPFGLGRIVIDKNWSGFREYLDGPLPVKENGDLADFIECRIAKSKDGNNVYLYLVNKTYDEVTFSLDFPVKSICQDIWNDRDIDLSNNKITMSGKEILLIKLNP